MIIALEISKKIKKTFQEWKNQLWIKVKINESNVLNK